MELENDSEAKDSQEPDMGNNPEAKNSQDAGMEKDAKDDAMEKDAEAKDIHDAELGNVPISASQGMIKMSKKSFCHWSIFS